MSALTAEHAGAVGRCLGMPLAHFAPVAAGKGNTLRASAVDGADVVVKWLPGRQPWLPTALAYGERLRQCGYPSPRTLAHGPVLGGYGMVQELLPGAPAVDGLGSGLLAEVLAAVELQAEAGGDGDPAWVSRVVHDDAMGWWQAARRLGPEAAACCDDLASWLGAAAVPAPRIDLVHFDLNATNVLHHGDRLTGIVDIDHLSCGDRCVDLVTLVSDLIIRERLDTVPRLVERILGISGRAGWRQAGTYHGIAQLSWAGRPGALPTADAVRVIQTMMSWDC